MNDIVLKWAWRYHRLEVDEYGSVDEAIRAAEYASDAGEESLDHIEVVTEEGAIRVLTHDDVEALLKPIREQQNREYRERAAARPDVARIYLASKDGVRSFFANYSSLEEAHAEYARLAGRLGARVSLEPLD